MTVPSTLWDKPINRHRVNILRPRQNGCHFADNSFKCIFFNENACISIEISLKFVPKGPIYNIPALVQIIAWHRPGNKPLSEPRIVRLPTHICVFYIIFHGYQCFKKSFYWSKIFKMSDKNSLNIFLALKGLTFMYDMYIRINNLHSTWISARHLIIKFLNMSQTLLCP